MLHFNDCARVGLALVRAAARHGWHWDYLPPEKVRPQTDPGSGLGRLRWVPYWARRLARVSRADVVHVHYATSVPLIRQRPMPSRPYFLHLHGSDIRRNWTEKSSHALVQRVIDEAEQVFYTNLDTIELATRARPDAQYMPAFVQFEELPAWQPRENLVVFTSRWDSDKGVEKQLELATRLIKAFPKVRFEALDWGPGAEAARQAGVVMRPRMSHGDFLNWLSRASLGIGQANQILAISEFEAMGIGLPVAAWGKRIARPEDNTTPPVIEGNIEDILLGVRQTLGDPAKMSAKLGGRQWVLNHHQADSYVSVLETVYRQAAG